LVEADVPSQKRTDSKRGRAGFMQEPEEDGKTQITDENWGRGYAFQLLTPESQDAQRGKKSKRKRARASLHVI